MILYNMVIWINDTLLCYTCWHMFLYWYKPSLATWLFLSSTQRSRYFSIIGSWIFCHVRCLLLLMTSYKASKALCFFPTSMNSEADITNPKCTNPDPARGAYNAPPIPIVGWGTPLPIPSPPLDLATLFRFRVLITRIHDMRTWQPCQNLTMSLMPHNARLK